jgi:thiamine-phosphate diphosphorylase
MLLPRIWLITMPEDPRGPVAPLEQALKHSPPGTTGVQLRAKESSDRQVVEWGHALRDLTRRHSAPLLVNRRADVASVIDADGVHLPEGHLGVERVRSLGSAAWLIGVSCHDPEGLRRAEAEGADFAALSPVSEVPGKAPPLGVEGFASAIEGVGIPTFALGGVQPAHVDCLIRAGAAGLALRRPAYSNDPAASLLAYLRELDKPTQSDA